MKYCPECRDEFEDWVEMCPDCRVPLVKELPPPEKRTVHDDDELVLAATAANEIEAKLLQGILEDAGIPAMIKVAESTNIYMSPLALRHELYVLEADEEKAKDVLGEIEEEEPPSES